MRCPLLIIFLISFGAISQEIDTTHIYFDVNKTEVTNFKTDNIKGEIILIEAHTDASGSAEYNLRLANMRIKSIKKALTANGHDLSETKINAFGEAKATSSGLTPERCRRVDIIYRKPTQIITNNTDSINNSNQYEKDTTAMLFFSHSNDNQIQPIKRTVEQTEAYSEAAIEAFVIDTAVTELKLDLAILFKNSSDKFLMESNTQLKELKRVMKKYPDLQAEFHGHVCCMPHQQMSEDRAKVVCNYLIRKGIDKSRLSYVGHSNLKPKVWPELSSEDEKLNRRVTVVFKK